MKDWHRMIFKLVEKRKTYLANNLSEHIKTIY